MDKTITDRDESRSTSENDFPPEDLETNVCCCETNIEYKISQSVCNLESRNLH